MSHLGYLDASSKTQPSHYILPSPRPPCGEGQHQDRPLLRCVKCNKYCRATCHRPLPLSSQDWACEHCTTAPDKPATRTGGRVLPLHSYEHAPHYPSSISHLSTNPCGTMHAPGLPNAPPSSTGKTSGLSTLLNPPLEDKNMSFFTTAPSATPRQSFDSSWPINLSLPGRPAESLPSTGFLGVNPRPSAAPPSFLPLSLPSPRTPPLPPPFYAKPAPGSALNVYLPPESPLDGFGPSHKRNQATLQPQVASPPTGFSHLPRQSGMPNHHDQQPVTPLAHRAAADRKPSKPVNKFLEHILIHSDDDSPIKSSEAEPAPRWSGNYGIKAPSPSALPFTPEPSKENVTEESKGLHGTSTSTADVDTKVITTVAQPSIITLDESPAGLLVAHHPERTASPSPLEATQQNNKPDLVPINDEDVPLTMKSSFVAAQTTTRTTTVATPSSTTARRIRGLDCYIYRQEGASTPPLGIDISTPSPPPPPSPSPPPGMGHHPLDALFFARIDPRTHWTRPRPQAWYDEQQQEIARRPGRKARFGQAAESLRRRMVEEARASPPALRDRVPERVRRNPAWLRALAKLEDDRRERLGMRRRQREHEHEHERGEDRNGGVSSFGGDSMRDDRHGGGVWSRSQKEREREKEKKKKPDFDDSIYDVPDPESEEEVAALPGHRRSARLPRACAPRPVPPRQRQTKGKRLCLSSDTQ